MKFKEFEKIKKKVMREMIIRNWNHSSYTNAFSLFCGIMEEFVEDAPKQTGKK